MAAPVNPVVLIPARMASTRLAGKPLADICGAPMIVQVWRRAMEADLGPVFVAAGEQEIADAVTAAGGAAVLTRADHPSGSDRIFEALSEIDADGRFDAVVNLQGDLPTLDPALPRRALDLLDGDGVDIGTLAAPITETGEESDPNVVKAVVAAKGEAAAGGCGRALYFSQGLRELLAPELRLALRYDDDLAVAFFDINGFKSINDQLGHAQGDWILTEVAGIVRAAVRRTDLAARWGGDELVVACPSLDRPGAERLCSTIQRRAARAVPIAGFGIAAGIATLNEQEPRLCSAAQLIDAADREMYRRKAEMKATPQINLARGTGTWKIR